MKRLVITFVAAVFIVACYSHPASSSKRSDFKSEREYQHYLRYGGKVHFPFNQREWEDWNKSEEKHCLTLEAWKAHFARRQQQEAELKLLKQEIRLDRATHGPTYMKLGDGQINRWQFAQALATYETCIEKCPKYVAGYLGKAHLLASCYDPKFRNLPAAIAAAESAAKVDRDDLVVPQVVALLHACNGDYARAIAWQNKVPTTPEDERCPRRFQTSRPS